MARGNVTTVTVRATAPDAALVNDSDGPTFPLQVVGARNSNYTATNNDDSATVFQLSIPQQNGSFGFRITFVSLVTKAEPVIVGMHSPLCTR